MKRLLTICAVLILAAGSAGAQGSVLTVDLAQKSVDITTGFNGAHLQLFGVQDQPGEIVVVIYGPNRDMVVRKKERIFGVWANLSGMQFKDVPVYYDYALADVELEDALPELFQAHDIGLSALNFETKGGHKEDKVKVFRDSLIRNKQADGLYPLKPQPVEFINDHFFKVSFYIPSNVPVGEYKIQTFLIHKGSVQEIKMTNVTVGQVGASAGIRSFALDNALIYGLLCVIFALFMGWTSSAIRNRS